MRVARSLPLPSTPRGNLIPRERDAENMSVANGPSRRKAKSPFTRSWRESKFTIGTKAPAEVYQRVRSRLVSLGGGRVRPTGCWKTSADRNPKAGSRPRILKPYGADHSTGFDALGLPNPIYPKTPARLLEHTKGKPTAIVDEELARTLGISTGDPNQPLTAFFAGGGGGKPPR